MQLTTLTLAALSIASTLAQQTIKTHVVRVGSMDASKALTFSPAELTVAPGELVQFQFAPKNHTVTQSTFDKPCEPLGMNSNVTGIYSGFIPVDPAAQMTATYTVMVNSTAPLWLYCSQGKHCQSGMVMVINAPAANPAKTLAAYKALAANAPANLPGDAVAGGVSNGTTPANGGSGSGSGNNGGSNNGGAGNGGAGGAETSGTPSPSGTPTESASAPGNTGAAGMVRVGEALGLSAVVALGFAVLM